MHAILHAISLSCAALSAALPLAARAGVVDRMAPNKTFLQARAEVSFVGAATTLRATDTHSGLASTLGDFGYVNDVLASRTLLPFSGDANDQATGDINVDFVAGSGAADDTFAFTTNASASAVLATSAAGEPASALVRLTGSFMFYLDPAYGGVPAGTVVGSLNLDSLPSPIVFESYTLSVFDGGVLVARHTPGTAPRSVALKSGHGYQAVFDYTLAVPNGIDPVYSLSVGGSVSAVPEPSVAALAMAGALLLAWRAGRLRRTARPA